MKVIQIINQCEITGGSNANINFSGGEFYIISDDFYNKLKIIIPDNLGIEIPFKEIYNKYTGQDLNNRKLLALRHGGGGDILFMITGLTELKRIYLKSSLNVAISPSYLSLVQNNPNIDKIISLPISLTEWDRYNYHLIFENIIENNPLAHEYNAYDLFMIKMGLNVKQVLPENKIPNIYINPSEELDVEKDFPNLLFEHKRIGIQVEASSPIRKYLPYNFVKVSKELIKKGYDIYFFGSTMQENTIDYLIKEVGDHSFKIVTDMRKALAVASYMDYFIAPDSLFIHVAGAFGIPVIGIYGPFHSDLRMKYFKKSIGINAKVPCSPCFKHGHHPCDKGDPSPCLNLITPEIILMALEELEK